VGDYICERRIGAGSSGIVWKAYHRNDRSTQRAIKSVSKEKLSTNKSTQSPQEIALMQRIQHPNIVRLYETKVRNTSNSHTSNPLALPLAICIDSSLTPLVCASLPPFPLVSSVLPSPPQTTERHHYLILEYCAGGDLSKWIRRHGAIPEPQALYWLGQLALGLKYLRAGNLIHRVSREEDESEGHCHSDDV
jgi:serine/threonine-protein kinase ULK/ATG1